MTLNVLVPTVVGARFGLVQFAGFSGAQACDYPFHIIVRRGRTT
jgi:hypothetical protein